MIISARVGLNNFFVITVILAVLYFAREILVPIELAALLGFVLTWNGLVNSLEARAWTAFRR